MSYLVLARKYRSQAFSQLVGQAPIVQTLTTAIASNRVAHAYLFTGTRGVGKTSSARLFADAINNPTQDPQLRKAILSGSDVDVIEIDAASNNTVEQARELIANAVYRPMRGGRKIYIIDECHMLSPSAFNALLKVMEEPPDHVVFILCTTETHKVPSTVQSRCQRFDFCNISATEIAVHLKSILKTENIPADDDLIFMIAKLGNGSMRDALSLTDRVLATGEKHLAAATLERLLGLPQREVLDQLVDAIAHSDPPGALETTHQLLARGLSIDQLMTSLAERFRDLMIIAACGKETDILETSDESREKLAQQAQRFDPAGLVHMIALLESCASRAKLSSFPRALIDAAIVRLALTERFADVAELVAGNLPKLPTSSPPAQSPPAKKA